MFKRAAVWIIKVAVLALVIDGILGIFAVISIYRGNPYRLYYPGRLASQVEDTLAAEAVAPPTGWPSKGDKLTRDHPSLPRECGSAWGGSFTFSPDVPDNMAWPYLVSRELGCDIANYGVPAFAMDQTYLLYQEYSVPKSVIVLGMSMPMITTSALSSWTFFDLDGGLPSARRTKPFFLLENGQLVLHRRPAPTIRAILDYYKADGYGSEWNPLSFPFSRSVVRAFQRKSPMADAIHDGPMSESFRPHRAVTSAIIRAMAEEAETRGDDFALLLIPHPTVPSEDFKNFLLASIADVPKVCFVDPTAEIDKTRAALSKPSDLISASGHYSAQANAAIARALVKGLADCGIHP